MQICPHIARLCGSAPCSSGPHTLTLASRQELLLKRVSTLEDTTRGQQQQIADLVNDLRRADKTAAEARKSLKDAELAAQRAQSVAALEITELKSQLSELQTHEAAARSSSRLYSSVGGIARPAADGSEIARLQGMLERETLARARAEADALDLETRLADLQRASSRRRPPAEGDSHEAAGDGGGGGGDLRDQVAHLQKRLAQAEATLDASPRESVSEREVHRKNMQLEQQVMPRFVCRVAGWQGRAQLHASVREVRCVARVGRNPAGTFCVCDL